jgi:saccharopine dehydrogenase-like NADP-dependent oxidoreductase
MSLTALPSRGDTRVLLICGADQPDSRAWRLLARANEIGEILVAAHDGPRAASLAADLGGKATPVDLDSSGSGRLIKALRDVDIVLNSAGSSARFCRDVLSAAIATGTHYLDSCDSWQPVLEMLELDDAARVAGTVAVVGMGASSGASNLLAVRAMDECDTVDRVVSAWRSPPHASMWEGNEQIKIWREGALADAYALEELTLT